MFSHTSSRSEFRICAFLYSMLYIIFVRARLFGEEEMEDLPLSVFLSTVGSLKFRGTSILFRLPQSCMCNLEQQRNKLKYISLLFYFNNNNNNIRIYIAP